MSKANFLKTDWFFGIVVSVVMLFMGGSDLMQSLERKAYDLGLGAAARTPSDRVAVIAIDEQSLANIGRWPWSRDILADMIEKLAAAKAKVIATTILFSEPQLDPGLVYINRLTELYNQGGGKPLTGTPEELAEQTPLLAQMAALLREAEQKLNTDRRLATAITQAGNVALPMLFRLGEPQGRPDRDLPDYVKKTAIKAGAGGAIPASGADALVIDTLGNAATTVGHLNVTPDVDGGIRTEPLVVGYFDQTYPALSLMIAAKSLNLTPADIQVQAGDSVKLGKLRIGTDGASRMLTFFYKDKAAGQPAFAVDSFFDVKTGKIPFDKYRDKIVLIGPTAAGVGSMFVTPVSPNMPSVLMQAHTVSSLLSEHFVVAPSWGGWAETGIFLLVAIYIIVLLPRLSAGMAAGFTVLLLLLLVGAHFGLMTTQLMWLQLMAPATLLLVGHLLLTVKRFAVTERGKEKSDLASAESNRMLGLAFQGQGQLDMAFDKFQKCPLDEQLMENMYNLALDFERKRQFNKAEAVFRHMAAFNPKFKDLEQRLNRAKQMSETVILGGTGGHPGGSMALGEGAEKPMLGRYQVEKELGKGAMGVVYLGRDPKINRVVAIKTMALSQEFDEDELKDVKERFFREAETAGRLNHPNIVQIYDAGEEHDLAFIAMEFLKGKDLVAHTKPGNLLPLPKAMNIVMHVAEALSYAHANNVVHRDIKPANFMYEPESDKVKVTDFGIARITDSSKTKTGMVLGTPSYMSPEQLSGKKIDGRSDLFSLGVTLYQLASGKLPFEGDSMAQLMFKIANDQQPDIRTIKPELPDCLVAIIDRALLKDPEQRYQTGGEMAKDLRTCLALVGTGDAAGDVDLAI